MNALKEHSVKVRRILGSWVRVEGSGFVLSIRRQRDLVTGVAGPDLSRVWMVTGMRSFRA